MKVKVIKFDADSQEIICRVFNPKTTKPVIVDPFVGLAIDLPIDVEQEEYIKIGESLIGKCFDIPDDVNVYNPRPVLLPSEGEFIEIPEPKAAKSNSNKKG